MKIQSSLLLLALAAAGANAKNDHAFLRRAFADDAAEALEQYSCTMEGASGQSECDASKDESGKTCVWCSIGSFGACLSADQAALIEDKIPGLTCDDEPGQDDDAAPDNDDENDDAAPPSGDDDASPPNSDDDAYWKCLKDGSGSEEDCGSHGGCKWCTTKAGFGVCLDEKAAEAANKSDWFDCKLGLALPELELVDLRSFAAEEEEDITSEEDVGVPGDPACIMATLQQDESVCTSTVDAGGNPCSWCSIDNFDVCLDGDLAAMAKTYGASCGGDVPAAPAEGAVIDPAPDTTCLLATLPALKQDDESACTSTVAADGHACEWCEIGTTQVCLNANQAQFAQELGGSCDDPSSEEVASA